MALAPRKTRWYQAKNRKRSSLGVLKRLELYAKSGKVKKKEDEDELLKKKKKTTRRW
jgi:hypothetical protein